MARQGRVGLGTVVAACALLALPASAAAAVIGDPADVHGPLDLRQAEVIQRLHGIALRFQVVGPLRGRDLDPTPDRQTKAVGELCVVMRPDGSGREKRLCLGRSGHRPWTVGVQTLGHSRRVIHQGTLEPRAVHAGSTSVRAFFSRRKAMLALGRYRLHAYSLWAGRDCHPKACRDRAPNGRSVSFELVGRRVVGCRDRGIGVVFRGPARPKRIALTFDDGPSDYTAAVISELANGGAHGTFFELGQEIPGREAVMQGAIAHGDELGDHSTHHTFMPSQADIAETARRIKAATGFRPCLFRPPGGAYNDREVAAAQAEGMSTVIWDVDPQDWSRPGAETIYQRVVTNIHPGAIVIMHDGGGDRSETVAALPRIIANLKARGYRRVRALGI